MIHSNAGKNDQKRFSDKNLDTTYKYTVKNGKLAEKVEWTAKVGSQLLLLLSHDGENWTEFYRWNGTLKADGSGGMDAAIVTYDLTEYVDFSKSNDLYIRVADSFPETGWGGNIYTGVEVVLDLLIPKMDDAQKDAVEAEADDRSISFMTCSKGFGAYKVDKENKVAGASSLMMNVGGGQAPSTVFATPIDGTGYDALELELYVSDLALFDVKFGNTQLELTSSGQCDQEEIGWNLATIKDCIVGEPQVGWNHVVLYMSEAATRGDNPFDISRINFFRFFMVQPKDADGNAINGDINVGIDNLRLTKAGAERDAQIAAENQAAADRVIERIDKIGEVTIDSIRAIEKAEGEYDELTRAQKELVTNYDVLTAARAKYDELKAAADAEANKPAEDENTPSGDENKPSDETTGEDEKPADENKPTDEKPVDEEGGSNVVIIIVVVAVVVVAAVVVVIILAKKNKKK
jgi:hypothetical protein